MNWPTSRSHCWRICWRRRIDQLTDALNDTAERTTMAFPCLAGSKGNETVYACQGGEKENEGLTTAIATFPACGTCQTPLSCSAQRSYNSKYEFVDMHIRPVVTKRFGHIVMNWYCEWGSEKQKHIGYQITIHESFNMTTAYHLLSLINVFHMKGTVHVHFITDRLGLANRRKLTALANVQP